MSTDTAGGGGTVESTPTAPETKRAGASAQRTHGVWWRGSSALGFFFPVGLDGAHRLQAGGRRLTTPPTLFFTPTLDQFKAVFDRASAPALLNSAFVTVVSTIFVLVLGVPAAFALSLRPVQKTKDALFFFISTKMFPIVAAIIPLYVIVRRSACSTTSGR